MKRALLAVYTDGHFTELSRLARRLATSGAWQPLVYFARLYPQKARDLGTCQTEGWPHLDHAGSPPADEASPDPPAPRPSAAARARGLLRRALVSLPFPFTAVRAVARQGQQLQRARRVIAEHQPRVIVVAEDTVGYETAALIRAGHERGVPSVIVPFTVANALEPAEAYYRDPAFDADRGANRLAARLYPRWVYHHRARRLLRLPGPQLLAKEWWDLAPPLPWIMNSGSADALAAESPFMEAYYRREGLPPPRLVVTGTLADDVLAGHLQQAAGRRAALCAEFGLPGNRPLLVSALPPDQFGISGVQSEFADYGEMAEFWVRTLASLDGWNVVIRLHPRMDATAYRYLEQWGPRLCQWDTAALVPLCDLYVACVSATIRWAVACGKPVVNYDLYRLRWTDYADAPGVLRVEDKGEFVALVGRLAADRTFYESVLASQRADAPRWGNLDGQAAARLLELMDAVGTAAAAGAAARKEA